MAFISAQVPVEQDFAQLKYHLCAGPVDEDDVDAALLGKYKESSVTLRGESESDELFRGDWQLFNGKEWSIAHAKIVYMVAFFAQPSTTQQEDQQWMRYPHVIALIHEVCSPFCKKSTHALGHTRGACAGTRNIIFSSILRPSSIQKNLIFMILSIVPAFFVLVMVLVLVQAVEAEILHYRPVPGSIPVTVDGVSSRAWVNLCHGALSAMHELCSFGLINCLRMVTGDFAQSPGSSFPQHIPHMSPLSWILASPSHRSLISFIVNSEYSAAKALWHSSPLLLRFVLSMPLDRIRLVACVHSGEGESEDMSCTCISVLKLLSTSISSIKTRHGSGRKNAARPKDPSECDPARA